MLKRIYVWKSGGSGRLIDCSLGKISSLKLRGGDYIIYCYYDGKISVVRQCKKGLQQSAGPKMTSFLANLAKKEMNFDATSDYWNE